MRWAKYYKIFPMEKQLRLLPLLSTQYRLTAYICFIHAWLDSTFSMFSSTTKFLHFPSKERLALPWLHRGMQTPLSWSSSNGEATCPGWAISLYLPHPIAAPSPPLYPPLSPLADALQTGSPIFLSPPGPVCQPSWNKLRSGCPTQASPSKWSSQMVKCIWHFTAGPAAEILACCSRSSR